MMMMCSTAAAPCEYDLTILQYPINCGVGTVVTWGHGLNESGAVVGHYWCPVWNFQETFLWTPEGGFTTLQRPPGVESASANDISDAGMIVGTYLLTGDGYRGFVYWEGEYLELEPLGGGAWSGASAISELGEVVGSRSIFQDISPFNAFVWSAESRFNDLGVMTGPNSAAQDISEHGEVVGWTGVDPANSTAFVWDRGTLLNLGPIPGGCTSTANGVSPHAGYVAGSGLMQVEGESSASRAYLWRRDQFLAVIPPLPGYETSGAGDVNDAGQVVGHCTGNPNSEKGFLWDSGTTFDLNDLMAAKMGVEIERAVTINNTGQILAVGDSPTGLFVTVLLTPIDLPPGDVDLDCAVGVNDLLSMLADWGPCLQPQSCLSDIDGDGNINVLDLLILLANWS